MAREEIFRRRQPLMTLPAFTQGLRTSVENLIQEKRVADMELVTYHRVGQGLLEPKISRDGFVLELFQGQLSLEITPEQIFGGNNLEARDQLITPAQVREYYAQVGNELAEKIKNLNFETFFVVYGGEGEKFQAAVDLVDRLSSLAETAGKLALCHFYLLSCPCESLSGKANQVSQLRAGRRLEAIIYNSQCNAGMGDLEVIANCFLHETRE